MFKILTPQCGYSKNRSSQRGDRKIISKTFREESQIIYKIMRIRIASDIDKIMEAFTILR